MVPLPIDIYREYRWDDLRFPAANLAPGTANNPTWNNTYGIQEFDIGDYLFAAVQMPHAWEEGTAISPHVHWCKITSAAGYVKWQIDWYIADIGSTLTSGGPSGNDVPAVSDSDTAWHHALTSFDDIAMTGKSLSNMILFKISRVAATTGSEYGTRAALLEFDIHYRIDSLGSRKEYQK